ncbi:LysR family transcriptional regulator [Caviibacterium pharyngocola]|uniref:LysR family transcriptional regulator n=1 Tax=Caviibacterium pharyngocola TaxID=28159 RepID=A0A2M8RU35_9PAST|nr:LysR family transcriptional regulator [Caviibacterium pharyngocola]PJG82403.1 LysR family transcriptional regulator [Caviibacterium pharyngocola]
MDRLTAIKVFLTVAETGSFTATADKLEMSKPMVSRHIALIEEWLNARLFHRTTRLVTLTEAGEQAVRYCRQIANLVEDVEQEAVEQDGELRGVIRLTSSLSFSTSHLLGALHQFQTLHPNLKIHLNLSEESLNLVEERIDLAIRISSSPNPALIARPLAPCHSVLVATADYLARFGTPQLPKDLQQHRCLAHSNVNRSEWSFSQNGEQIQLTLNNVFSTNEASSLKQITMLGGGISMLPRYLVEEELNAGTLVPLLTDWELPKMQAYALYSSRNKLPKAVRILLDFLVECFKDKPW